MFSREDHGGGAEAVGRAQAGAQSGMGRAGRRGGVRTLRPGPGGHGAPEEGKDRRRGGEQQEVVILVLIYPAAGYTR